MHSFVCCDRDLEKTDRSMATPTRLQLAINSIERARKYTLQLLDGLEPGDWFRQPSEGVSHIAWQVGNDVA